MQKQRSRLIVGTLISLLLLGWVVGQTEWGLFIERLRGADLGLLFAAFAAVLLNLLLRAWRWRIMLEPEDSVSSFSTVFDIVNVGYLANNILPARLGDIMRAYLAGEWTRATLGFALSTTVVERVLDTLFVVLLLFGTLPFLPVPPLAVRTGLLIGGLFAGGALLLAIAAWRRASSEQLLRRLLRPLPLDEEQWGERLVTLLDGFALLRQPRRLARVLASSVLIWLVALLGYWLTFLAFGMPTLGPLHGAFVLSLGALSLAAPSAPSGAGTFDAAAAWALLILGVPEGLAGGIALVLHLTNFSAVILLGSWSLLRRGLSLGLLATHVERAEPTEPLSPS